MCVCVFAVACGEKEVRRWEEKVSRSSAILRIMYFQYIFERFLIFYPNPNHHLVLHTTLSPPPLPSGFDVCNMIHNSDCVRLDLTGFIICLLVVFFLSLLLTLFLSLLYPFVVFYLSVIKQKANVLAHTAMPK